MFEKRKHVDYVEQLGERINGTTILGALLLSAAAAAVAYGIGSNKGFQAGYNAVPTSIRIWKQQVNATENETSEE